MSANQYSMDDLLYLMSRLRDPETGCPWDLKQDFSTIVPHTIEETYEVADAIASQDWEHVKEELGDLLFQVIFYAQMGKEKSLFDFPSVTSALVEKLVRRHPHVFPEGTLNSQRQPGTEPDMEGINRRWEEIKQLEKKDAPPKALLDDVPLSFPAVTRAFKLQKKASSVGFDWQDIGGVLDKIHEELDETKAELAAGDDVALEKEIGDLLFAVINLARHKKINPEAALRGTNERFYQRFRHVERAAEQAGGWEGFTSTQMNDAWDAAKRLESDD